MTSHDRNQYLLSSAAVEMEMLDRIQTVSVEICYCSIHQRCWRDTDSSVRGATPVAECQPNEQSLLDEFIDEINDGTFSGPREAGQTSSEMETEE